MIGRLIFFFTIKYTEGLGDLDCQQIDIQEDCAQQQSRLLCHCAKLSYFFFVACSCTAFTKATKRG